MLVATCTCISFYSGDLAVSLKEAETECQEVFACGLSVRAQITLTVGRAGSSQKAQIQATESHQSLSLKSQQSLSFQDQVTESNQSQVTLEGSTRPPPQEPLYKGCPWLSSCLLLSQ